MQWCWQHFSLRILEQLGRLVGSNFLLRLYCSCNAIWNIFAASMCSKIHTYGKTQVLLSLGIFLMQHITSSKWRIKLAATFNVAFILQLQRYHAYAALVAHVFEGIEFISASSHLAVAASSMYYKFWLSMYRIFWHPRFFCTNINNIWHGYWHSPLILYSFYPI